MKILLIHQAFAALDEAGGTRHHELARYLVQKGHKVTVIASPVSYLTGTDSGKQQQVIDGVVIRRAYTYNALHRSFVHRVFSFFSFMVSSFLAGLSEKEVDVIWGTSPPIFQGFSAWLLSRLKSIPFLFEVRDLWPDFAIAVGVLKNPILIKMSFWLEKFLYRNADRVLVNSPGYVNHVGERGARLVELIPNGADPAMFYPEQHGETFRSVNGLQNDFIILYAGAHGMSNDLHILLESAKILEDNPKIRFVFLGDGKEKANLQKSASDSSLKNVLFLPSVPKNEMAEALSASDACIAILKPLTEYKTTFPNKVFDYMAAGRPVILAIEGVIRDVVEEADCGVYPKPGDSQDLANAIQFLEADREHAAILGRKGREFLVSHYSREMLAEKLELMFLDIKKNKSRVS